MSTQVYFSGFFPGYFYLLFEKNGHPDSHLNFRVRISDCRASILYELGIFRLLVSNKTRFLDFGRWARV